MINRSEVLRRVGQDQQILLGVIEDFLLFYPDMIANLRSAMEAGAGDRIVRAAHILKSAAAAVGAHELRELARHLEESGRNGDLLSAPEVSQRIYEEVALVDAELRRWQDELP